MGVSGCVIRREGVRGAVWYAKYRDSAGTQVKKALGREADGWTETKAQRELRKLLDAVANGYRKPKRTTFAEFSKRFQEEYLPGRNLKRSSVIAYESDLRPASEKTPAGHLLGFFGRYELTEIASRPELVDAYIARKTSEASLRRRSATSSRTSASCSRSRSAGSSSTATPSSPSSAPASRRRK